MDVGAFLKDNWAVISAAPWAFVVCAIICLGAGYGGASILNASANSTKDQRLQLADERVADYQDKLSGQSPDEVKSRIDVLEQKIAALQPQHLSLEARNTITAAISGHPKYRIVIAQDMAAPQAKPMVSDFAALFQEAGWNVQLASVLGIGSPPPTGIALNVIDTNALRPAEQLLKDALERAKIRFDIRAGIPPNGPIAVVPDVGLLLTAPAN
jgi:hypothetical protein